MPAAAGVTGLTGRLHGANPRVGPGTPLWLGDKRRICTEVMFDKSTATYRVVTDDGPAWWLAPRELEGARREAESRFQNQLTILDPARVTAFQWILIAQKLVDICAAYRARQVKVWRPATDMADENAILAAFRAPLGLAPNDVLPHVFIRFVKRLPDFPGPPDLTECAEKAWDTVMNPSKAEKQDGK